MDWSLHQERRQKPIKKYWQTVHEHTARPVPGDALAYEILTRALHPRRPDSLFQHYRLLCARSLLSVNGVQPKTLRETRAYLTLARRHIGLARRRGNTYRAVIASDHQLAVVTQYRLNRKTK